MQTSPLLTQLMEALRCLPGVGPKSAQRMAFTLLQRDRSGGMRLAQALTRAMSEIGHCADCRTFTEQEVKKLTEYYSGHTFMEVRNRLMLMTFFDTGIRVSELIDLKLSQVKDEYILIHGKGDKERVVPKSPLLNKWMFKYLNTRENFFAYRRVPENVFLSRNGRPMTTEAIHRVIKIAGKAVGVSRDIRVSPHTCRHTFAQMQLKNGLDLYSLSRLMGHSNISITQRYLEGLRDFEVLNACKATGILMNL